MKTYRQERPEWCKHKDCQFRRRVVDSICGGEMPEPLPHRGDLNTHRFCLKGALQGNDGVFDLQVNASDLDWFRWIFDALDGKRTSSLSVARMYACNGNDQGYSLRGINK